jgi:hypothetical protein
MFSASLSYGVDPLELMQHHHPSRQRRVGRGDYREQCAHEQHSAGISSDFLL